MLMILNEMGMRDLTPNSTVQGPGVTFRPPDLPFLNRDDAVLSDEPCPPHLSRLLGNVTVEPGAVQRSERTSF